ncbi:MAG TPA: hypothetical protein HA224_04930 [Nanoarchaeota archaeon]|nr:hypothetical protein [Nanoarchaeota archaeon]
MAVKHKIVAPLVLLLILTIGIFSFQIFAGLITGAEAGTVTLTVVVPAPIPEVTKAAFEGKSFPLEIMPPILIFQLQPGQSKTDTLTIKNKVDRVLDVDFDLADLGDFLAPDIISKIKFSLTAGESIVKNVPVSAVLTKAIGKYYKDVQISVEDFIRQVPVIIQVIPKDKKIDVTVLVETKELLAGSNLIGDAIILSQVPYNFTGTARISVKDAQGRDIIVLNSTRIYLDAFGKVTIPINIKLLKNQRPAIYLLDATVDDLDGNYMASGLDDFTVIRPEGASAQFFAAKGAQFNASALLTILVPLLLLILLLLSKKHRREDVELEDTTTHKSYRLRRRIK